MAILVDIFNKEKIAEMVLPRGCGSRKIGGVYLVCGTSPWGRPLEEFVICPPIPIDLQAWGVADIGTTLIEKEAANGERISHVVDVVGSKYYPNVADFLEETRRMGVSRRSSLGTAKEYARLTPGSRLLLVHRRADISNYLALTDKFMNAEERRATRCPHGRDGHHLWRTQGTQIGSDEMCGQLWYHDIEGEIIPLTLDEQARYLDRHLVSTSTVSGAESFPRVGRRSFTDHVQYLAHQRPAGFQPNYKYALFASFPIQKIELVDPKGSYRDKAKRASASSLPFEVVKE